MTWKRKILCVIVKRLPRISSDDSDKNSEISSYLSRSPDENSCKHCSLWHQRYLCRGPFCSMHTCDNAFEPFRSTVNGLSFLSQWWRSMFCNCQLFSFGWWFRRDSRRIVGISRHTTDPHGFDEGNFPAQLLLSSPSLWIKDGDEDSLYALVGSFWKWFEIRNFVRVHLLWILERQASRRLCVFCVREFTREDQLQHLGIAYVPCQN